jgi:hypothetical protein
MSSLVYYSDVVDRENADMLLVMSMPFKVYHGLGLYRRIGYKMHTKKASASQKRSTGLICDSVLPSRVLDLVY